jgi:DNA-binding phage protein
MARTAFDDYFDAQMANPAFAKSYRWARAEVDARDQFMRALEGLRRERGISKAKLARKSGMPASSVRKLLTSKNANPTLSSVFSLLEPLGYSLKIVPVADRAHAAPERAESARVPETPEHDVKFRQTPKTGRALAAFVTFARPSNVGPKVDVVAACRAALRACRSNASLMRMMPVFLWRFREQFCPGVGVPDGAAGRRLFGYLLCVAARLSGDALMAEASERFRPSTVRRTDPLLESQARNSYTVTRMRANPDAEAASWGFLLGPTNGYFESYFEKVRAA